MQAKPAYLLTLAHSLTAIESNLNVSLKTISNQNSDMLANCNIKST